MAESLGLLFAVVAVGLGSVGFALRALWRPPAGGWGGRLLAARDGALAERKEAALVALRELDHDHRVGGLDEGDYRVLRAELATDAVRALQAEDEQLRALDAAIEREVAEARARRRAAVAPAPTVARACRRCGRHPQPADRFCAGCGAPLVRPLPAERPAAGAAPVPLRRGPAGLGPRVARGARRPVVWLGAGGVLAVAFVAGTLWLTLSAPRRAAQQPLATLPVRMVRALAVDPADPRRLFAAHDAGLLASADGGRTWQPVAAATGAVEGVVAPAGAVYAAGRGLFLRSADGGRTWESLGERLPGAEARALAVDPADPSSLYAAVGGGLYRSQDGGDAWAPAGTPPPGVTALAVVPAGPGFPRQLWAATARDGVLASADGGTSWSNANGFVNGALPTRTILGLAYDPASGDRYEGPSGQRFAGAVYAATDRGLFKSTDGGYSWFRLPLEAPAAAVAVAPGGGVVLVADPSGRLFRSADRGLTWPGEAGP